MRPPPESETPPAATIAPALAEEIYGELLGAADTFLDAASTIPVGASDYDALLPARRAMNICLSLGWARTGDRLRTIGHYFLERNDVADAVECFALGGLDDAARVRLTTIAQALEKDRAQSELAIALYCVVKTPLARKRLVALGRVLERAYRRDEHDFLPMLAHQVIAAYGGAGNTAGQRRLVAFAALLLECGETIDALDAFVAARLPLPVEELLAIGRSDLRCKSVEDALEAFTAAGLALEAYPAFRRFLASRTALFTAMAC